MYFKDWISDVYRTKLVQNHSNYQLSIQNLFIVQLLVRYSNCIIVRFWSRFPQQSISIFSRINCCLSSFSFIWIVFIAWIFKLTWVFFNWRENIKSSWIYLWNMWFKTRCRLFCGILISRYFSCRPVSRCWCFEITLR